MEDKKVVEFVGDDNLSGFVSIAAIQAQARDEERQMLRD